MAITCPHCRAAIDATNINVAKDVAFCPKCGSVAALSELAHAGSLSPAPAQPPPGAWYEDDGVEMRVGATTRSWAAAFLIPFMMVWSGFSLGGIYGTQIAKGQFNLSTSLFGIPFVLGSVLFWSLALMAVGGKVEVRVRGGDGRVFVGLGSVGWRKQFDAAAVRSIRLKMKSSGRNGMTQVIAVTTDSDSFTFGGGLSDVRSEFVAGVLTRSLLTGGLMPAP